jgi:hypothetical protein
MDTANLDALKAFTLQDEDEVRLLPFSKLGSHNPFLPAVRP